MTAQAPREVHTIPVDDVVHHDRSIDCVCQPAVETYVRHPDDHRPTDDADRVLLDRIPPERWAEVTSVFSRAVTHSSADGRELAERTPTGLVWVNELWEDGELVDPDVPDPS